MKLFGWLKGLFLKAFGIARQNGLTDEVLEAAVELAKTAALNFVTNSERREWVVKTLMTRNIPESIARFAVEAAVQLIKKELQG